MNLIDGFLEELNYESATTRKVLERVPENRFNWTPHQKSMTLGDLASHVVNILEWVAPTVQKDEMALDPGQYKPFKAGNKAELLNQYDRYVAEARALLKGLSNEKLMATWTFKSGGTVIFALPRLAVLNSFILKHTVHHRAQLGVYLRLLDVPVPAIYGPSADDPGMPAKK